MRTSVAFALTLLCVAGCALQHDPAQDLAGKWEMQRMVGAYEFELPSARDGSTVITFEGHEFRYTNGDGPGDHSLSGTFLCDSNTTPNEIRFVFGEHTLVGSYALAGDELQICVGPDDAVAPRVLAGGPGERPALILFRRLKADEPK
jgi:uncharacterized protein (TIGR03067 family)